MERPVKDVDAAEEFCLDHSAFDLELAEFDLGDLGPMDAGPWCGAAAPNLAEEGYPSPLGALVYAPGLRVRDDVRYLVVRRWRACTKAEDLQAFRAAKQRLDPDLIAAAAVEVFELLSAVLGSLKGLVITNVPCGHSGRPDCFGKLLAREVAMRAGLPWVQAFADRLAPGSSHPRRNLTLPPIRLVRRPNEMTVVVDDLATTGFHLAEAVTALRERRAPALGIAWLGGVVR